MSIEREQTSTAFELMSLLKTLSPLQSFNSLSKISSVAIQKANPSKRSTSWLSEYLKKKAEEAKNKAEEDQAVADQAAADQAAAEQAAFEAQKQSHKENADFVYEGSDFFSADGSLNVSTGEPANWFLDIDSKWSKFWETANGDDVVYFKGNGQVVTNGGNDIVYMSEGVDISGVYGYEKNEKIWQCAKLGWGDDKVIAGEGNQFANGDEGSDYFEMGDGLDIARGGSGADEFVVDLKNEGFDFILDFVDTGDKITVLNGGEAAQQNDWYLSKTYSQDIISISPVYNEDIAMTQEFYEIRNADSELVASFGIGKSQGEYGKFNITASLDSGGIEILDSSYSLSASIEFI